MDNSAIITNPPRAECFLYGNNHWSMDYIEFQMFEEMGIYLSYGSFLSGDADENWT